MEIKKISDKYQFYQEGADYVLEIANKKAGEDTTTELIISGVEDSNLLTLHPSCGCTLAERILLPDGKVSAKIRYNDCDRTFTKIVIVKYKNVKLTTIKVKGTCQQ